MEWKIYIVRCADGTLYTGCTTDVKRRLYAHNGTSVGAKYTRVRRPVTLAYLECASSRSEALKREAQIKRLTRTQKIQLIHRDSLPTQ